MSRIARLMVYASVLSLLVSTRAAADPVSITSGFLVSTGPMGVTGVGVLGSGGFSVMGVAVLPPGHIDPFNDCSPCAPGAALSVGGVLDNAFMGQAKLGGNTYPLTTNMNSPNPLSWELFGSAIAPPASICTVAGAVHDDRLVLTEQRAGHSAERSRHGEPAVPSSDGQ